LHKTLLVEYVLRQMFDIICLTDAAFAHDADKMEDAEWNISKLDDLQCIVREDFLALCDLLDRGSEIVTAYPVWTGFWIEMDKHQDGLYRFASSLFCI